MGNTKLQKWVRHAASVAPIRPPTPQAVLLDEAVQVAKFVGDYWEAGLSTAGSLEASIGTEILELREAVSAAHAEYLLARPVPEKAPMERAQFVLRELRAALTFAFHDGVSDDADVALRRVAAATNGGASKHAVALSLETYTALARQYLGKLEARSAFDPALLEEAPQLARSLRDHAANKKVGTATEAGRAALDLRNRLVAVLHERVSLVRAAARYVFRHQPEIVREATSAYQRRRRARARQAKPPVP
jgi:hypothetical protein